MWSWGTLNLFWYTHVFVWCVCVYGCQWVDTTFSKSLFHFILLRQVSFTDPGAVERVTLTSQHPAVPASPALGSEACLHTGNKQNSCWGSELKPVCLWSKHLATELSPTSHTRACLLMAGLVEKQRLKQAYMACLLILAGFIPCPYATWAVQGSGKVQLIRQFLFIQTK